MEFKFPRRYGNMKIKDFEKESEIWQKSNPIRIREREYWLNEEIAKMPDE